MKLRVKGGAVFMGIAACNVPASPGSTGGVSLEGGVANGAEAGASGLCEGALAVVMSDYQATNVAVSKLDGTTLSGSFVSSGATRPGLSLALSGDVSVPIVAPASGRVVLIDEYGTDVLTWMKLEDASVIAQLPVGTGFYSNPHDYLEVGANRAYVSRFGTNLHPGALPFDQGGDVLIVDTTQPAITGRIAIPEENPALEPSPDAMTMMGTEVVLTLGRWSQPSFKQVGDGRFIGISPATNAVDWTVNVTGLQSCGRVAFSPSGRFAAIACSSMEDMATHRFDPTKSDVVLYDAARTPPQELRRLGLGATLGAGLQPAITFAGEDAIVVMTYGGNATPGDTVVSVRASTGQVVVLAESTKPFVLGGLHCAPGCGDVCVVGDAEKNVLRRWKFTDGAFMQWAPLTDVTVETTIGLPPRSIGGLR